MSLYPGPLEGGPRPPLNLFVGPPAPAAMRDPLIDLRPLLHCRWRPLKYLGANAYERSYQRAERERKEACRGE